MPTWNPDQYLKFGEERTQPCRDLAARITVENVRRVIDLGCGPGNSTKVLAERWPQAEISGLDSSEEMIESARASNEGGRWIVDDMIKWAESEAEQFDVVFSNAALQWVPDHALIYPKLLARTAEGGALAIQVPLNSNAPVQRIKREMASSPAWLGRLSTNVREWHSHDSAFYYDLLAPLCSRLDIWETEYIHVMPGVEAIVEWYKGTGLRPFLDALNTEADRKEFLAEYLERIRDLYPPRTDDRFLFPFRRSFLIAYRTG